MHQHAHAHAADDFRLFCGDLGNDVSDEVLANAFRHKYPSFAKAKVRRKVQEEATHALFSS